MREQLRYGANKVRSLLSSRPAPFYVASHERSGTHFLINTLSKNTALRPEFHGVGEWAGPYISGQKNEFGHIDWLRADWDAITARVSIIKTHADRELFDFRFPKTKAVYVMRDPRDTLVSFYYYLGQPHSSLSEFLRQPLSAYLRWANSRHGNSNSVAERWANHVKGWLEADDTVVVRYEELKTDYRGVLGRVSQFLNLKRLPFVAPVDLHEGYSIAPRKGVIGDWRNHFTDDDEALVRSAVEAAGLKWEAVAWRQ
jgi:hypothetical protein